MSDGFKKRGKALEEDYFRKEEKRAIQNLATEESTRKCPVCVTCMKTVMYTEVEIDVCDTCGGIWLDNGELEKIMENSGQESKSSWLSNFIKEIGW